MILQLVDAMDLHRALDYSVDFGEQVDDGASWNWKFQVAISEWRTLDSMLDEGQHFPICVSPGWVDDEDSVPGQWVMGNGHHRLSIALAAMTDVLVLFDEEGDWGHYAETSGDYC